MKPAQQANRLLWTITVGAFGAAVVLYGFVVYILQRVGSFERAAAPDAIRLGFAAAGTLALFASLAWMRWRLSHVEDESVASPAAALPPPDRYQTLVLIALALAEGAAVIGLAYCVAFRGTLADYAPYGVGSLAVIAFGVVPRGLRYWSAWESQARGQP